MGKVAANIPIRWAWEELTATDSALKTGEWAGVRSSTAKERKAVQARRLDVCYTFCFRHCGAVLRLVVGQDKIGPFTSSMRKLDRAIAGMIADKRISTPEPYSTTILMIAMAAAPEAHIDLERIRDTMRCETCTCILKDGGPLDKGSAQQTAITAELKQSQFAKENLP